MKNKRIIYWGGNDQTVIPRMGACGDGVEPSGGSGGAGDGQKKTKKNLSYNRKQLIQHTLGMLEQLNGKISLNMLENLKVNC